MTLETSISPTATPKIGGVVKAWNADRGYGFVKPEGGGDDLFVHISALPAGVVGLDVGQRVVFRYGKDPKSGRWRAVNIDMEA